MTREDGQSVHEVTEGDGWIRPSRRADATALLLVLAVTAYDVYRAATQSLTHDEARTWLLFVRGAPETLFAAYNPNHHVLHTMLVWITTSLFGFSELTLRLPSLIGGTTLLVVIWRWIRELGPHPALAVATLAGVALNPFVLDYLAVARGYGLALLFLTWALARTSREILRVEAEHDSRGTTRRSATTAILLGLAPASNLVFAIPAVAVLLLTGAIAWRRRRGRLGLTTLGSWMLASVLPALATTAAIVGVPLLRARPENFHFGSASLGEATATLVAASLSHHPITWLSDWSIPPRVVAALAGVAVPALLLLVAPAVWMGARRALAPRTVTGSATAIGALVTATTLAASVVGNVLAHHLVGIAYPRERTGIHLVVLFTLALGFAADALWQRGAARWIARGLAAALAALLIAFALQGPVGYFRMWRYDADAREVFAELRSRQRDSGRSLAVALVPPSGWMSEPVLNAYRLAADATWLAPIRRFPRAEDPHDLYLLHGHVLPPELVPHLEVVRAFPRSGLLLARRRE